MTTLCKFCYNNDKLLFKYRGSVKVPPLEMVDDIVTVMNCGDKSKSLNVAVNTFENHKKLKLSAQNCANIHIGNKASRIKCPEKKIYCDIMKESEKEKYLGDFLTTKANSKDTIAAKKARGYGILGEIGAILRDIPFGNWRTQIGLLLRKAWFLNSCLANSEVWVGISDSDKKDLEIIDHKILRVILGSQAKVPVEMLYLETSELPISHIISVRRLSYWHHILRRNKNELVHQIYKAMKENPLKGDWIHALSDDLLKIGMNLDDDENVVKLTKSSFKKIIKKNIRIISHHELESLKTSHDKVRFIVHQNLEKPQQYLTGIEFSNAQKSILFNLRSKCEKSFKDNFHKMHQNTTCMCKKDLDSQEHALVCDIVLKHLSEQDKLTLEEVQYSDIFSDLHSQHRITQLYQSIIKIKKRLLS